MSETRAQREARQDRERAEKAGFDTSTWPQLSEDEKDEGK